VVSTITIEGNHITKEYIIRREIQHQLDVPLDSTMVKADRDRIDNLSIFTSVKWEAELLDDGSVELVFVVIETWRIWPGAAPMYWEDKGWSFFGAVRVLNFRGRNQAFAMGGAVGALDMFGFQFSDPWFAGDHISFSGDIGRVIFQHPFLPYVQITDSFEAILGRWFGYKWKVRVGFELERKQFEGETDTLTYSYVAPQGSVAYDTRDIYRDPSEGISVLQQFYVMFHSSDSNRNRLVWTQTVGSYWSPVKGKNKLTLGLGLMSIATFGALDEVWINYFGGSYSIRGWSVPSREDFLDPGHSFRFGNQELVFSAEARKTIVSSSSVSALSLNAEYGLAVVGFIDVGVTSLELSDLFVSDPLIGMGFGIRVPVFGSFLRIDYGWAYYGGKAYGTSLNIGSGQKF
tara:strand:+ start:10209 stop:11417 length:1209 start_codon:yes stop_codon:yes gene_type:complete